MPQLSQANEVNKDFMTLFMLNNDVLKRDDMVLVGRMKKIKK